jgi:hypothetical protein
MRKSKAVTELLEMCSRSLIAMFSPEITVREKAGRME